MITSMTGYGQGEFKCNGYESFVEVRAVNHRFLDVSMRLPRALSTYEETVKEMVRKFVSRGRINLVVNLKSERETGLGLRLDMEAASYHKQLLEKLRDDLGLSGEVTIDHLLHFSEILTTDSGEDLPEEVWQTVESAIQQAMQNLNDMRQREGLEITNDLRSRVEMLQQKLVTIEERSIARRGEEFQRLYQRVKEMVQTKELDANRLELEVALLADRVDVTEECTRFRSHNTLFLEALAEEAPAGRKLNFLLQEMNREANTIGAKANDAKIAHLVVEIKEEVEKLREQIQNIE